MPGRLAARLALLNDRRNYRQEPSFDKDQRLYAAINLRALEPNRVRIEPTDLPIDASIGAAWAGGFLQLRPLLQ